MTTAWREVALGEVTDFVRGVTFKPTDVKELGSPGTIACLRTANVQAELAIEDVWAIPEAFARRPEQHLRAGDVVVSSANSWNLVGKCSWVSPLPWPATFGGFVTTLRAHPDRLNARYLYRWFSSPKTQAVVRSFGRKTTNISNLNLDRCRTMLMPLPPVEEQRRIAAILDAADELRAKRRKSLALLDTVKASIFLDMFGDPVTNSMEWDVVVLSSLGTLDRGVSKHRPRNAPELLGGPYPLVQTGDVANSGGYITRYTSTYSEVGLRQSRMWPAGTLCITIAANIAKTGLLTFEACFPDSVVGFTSPVTGMSEYVRALLGFHQHRLERLAPESAQKNINLKVLRELRVPAPPHDVVHRFAQAVRTARVEEHCLTASESGLDSLFASLQHRAFRREL